MSAPAYEKYPPGRDARELLEYFFAHEATFPKDPLALIRHIGIVVASNLAKTVLHNDAAYWESWSPSDGGSTHSDACCHPSLDLATDLRDATFEDEKRRVVLFDPDFNDASTMHAPKQTPAPQGWSVSKVYHHNPPDPCDYTQMRLCTVKYRLTDGTRQHTVTVTTEPPGGCNECVKCCAVFKLQGVRVFWYCHETFQVFCLYPEEEPFRLHAVSATPDQTVNLLYDGPSRVAWRVRRSLYASVYNESSWNVIPLRFLPGAVPFPGLDDSGGIFDPHITAHPWPKDDVGYEMLMREWERLFKGLAMLFSSVISPYVDKEKWQPCRAYGMGKYRAFPAIGRLLQQQMQRRLVRALRDTLLGMAQALEEERARDPVKRCAACAVQAAKDQLVLGLEPKRQRV